MGNLQKKFKKDPKYAIYYMFSKHDTMKRSKYKQEHQNLQFQEYDEYEESILTVESEQDEEYSIDDLYN